MKLCNHGFLFDPFLYGQMSLSSTIYAKGLLVLPTRCIPASHHTSALPDPNHLELFTSPPRRHHDSIIQSRHDPLHQLGSKRVT